MPSSKRSNSLFAQNAQTYEVSPGQMVIAVCSVLFLGLLCFLIGVVVGRYDHSFRDAPIIGRGGDAADEAPAVESERDEPQGEGHQVYPRPVVLPNSGRQTQPQDSPQIVDLPAPEARQEPAPAPQQPSAPAPPEPDPAPQAPAQPGPIPPPRPGDEPSVDTEAAEENAENDAPFQLEPLDASEEEALQMAGDPVELSSGGEFTIQLISYRTEDRQVAEGYASQMSGRTSLQTAMQPSEDGRFVRVFAGEFPDRPTADRALSLLQQRFDDFDESFVRQR